MRKLNSSEPAIGAGDIMLPAP